MSKLIKKAKQEEAENHLEVALTYYEMALSDPSCPFDIRCDMGVVYNKLRNFNEGLRCFDTVLNMDKNHINSLFGKGISCLGLNKWDSALDLFLKAKEIDNTNANIYYYISIILQSKRDDQSEEYYSKFMELDNEEFKQIRSDYNFGLIFLDAESELTNSKKINITGFEDVLKTFELNDDEIDFYLKTLPHKELISKINELNDLDYVETEKRIIRSQYLEMGFDDEDIDDYFILDSIDDLKKDVISRTNNNPFPDKNEINIPLYVKNGYNYIFEEITIEEKLTTPVSRTKPIENIFKKRYALIKEAISNKKFEDAEWLCDFIDETKISNESFRVNFIYMKGLILSYLKLDLNKVLDDFNLLEQDYPEITNDKKYILNKMKIKNDLEKINQEMVK